MNSGIIIYELEDYIYKLLKFRLSTFFPDGYIERGTSTELDNESIPFANSFHVLFDPTQFSFSQIQKFCEKITSPLSIIPIFKDSIDEYYTTIDCTHLFGLITSADYKLSEAMDNSFNANKGKLTVLIPFSYISERENLIKKHLSHLKDNHMCLRLNLMSGIRMPDTFTSHNSNQVGLSNILAISNSRRLKKEDILDCVNPDNQGFLTINKPVHSDDVFEYDIETIETLISTSKELTKDESYPMNILVVAEGFKISDLTRIAKLSDDLHFLLPERLYQDDLGFKEEIGRITRVVPPNVPITIHYNEKIRAEDNYETMPI